jgi:two-component sensor histidine kinase
MNILMLSSKIILEFFPKKKYLTLNKELIKNISELEDNTKANILIAFEEIISNILEHNPVLKNTGLIKVILNYQPNVCLTIKTEGVNFVDKINPKPFDKAFKGAGLNIVKQLSKSFNINYQDPEVIYEIIF